MMSGSTACCLRSWARSRAAWASPLPPLCAPPSRRLLPALPSRVGAASVAAAAPARGLASRPSKKRLSFKLAKKLLRVRNDAVPYRNRQKRGLLMNFAQYAINNPWESFWTSYVQTRLARATKTLEDVFQERYGLAFPPPREERSDAEGAEGEPGPLELPPKGEGELSDAYHQAGGDPEALLELMKEGHRRHSAQ